MKRTIVYLLFFTGLASLSTTSLYAQSTDVDTNIWMSKPVVVDGNSREWNEPLNNFNSETKLAFALGNDEKNLYLVIESLDEVTTSKLIRGGLTLNINTSGKKKDGIKLNFLGMQHSNMPDGAEKDSTYHHHEKVEHDPSVRSISVSGFKNIPDGVLAMPNGAGIQIAAAFNQHRDYICELAIPLAQLNLNGKEAKGIAYQLKINAPNVNQEHHHEGGTPHEGGMSRGGGMGGGGGIHSGAGRKGGGGGRMNSGTEHEPNEAPSKSDFWIKYELAKNSQP